MPKRPRSSVRIPWSEAIALTNDEAALTILLARRKGVERLDSGTLSRYRNAGVPVQELGEELLAAWRRAASAARSLPVEVDPSLPMEASAMPHVHQAAMQSLTRVYNERERNPERWAAVKELLVVPDEETSAITDPLVREISTGFAKMELLLNRLIFAFDQNRQGRLRQPRRHAE